MLEKSFNLLFYQKKRGTYVNGPIPIYMCITVDSVPKEFSVKRIWESARWSKTSCRAIGSKEDARSLNEFLDLLQGESV